MSSQQKFTNADLNDNMKTVKLVLYYVESVLLGKENRNYINETNVLIYLTSIDVINLTFIDVNREFFNKLYTPDLWLSNSTTPNRQLCTIMDNNFLIWLILHYTFFNLLK